MTDIKDLVEEFWKISSDRAIDVSFTAMRHLLEFLQVILFSFCDCCRFTKKKITGFRKHL
jgi:hypothetical protein